MWHETFGKILVLTKWRYVQNVHIGEPYMLQNSKGKDATSSQHDFNFEQNDQQDEEMKNYQMDCNVHCNLHVT